MCGRLLHTLGQRNTEKLWYINYGQTFFSEDLNEKQTEINIYVDSERNTNYYGDKG